MAAPSYAAVTLLLSSGHSDEEIVESMSAVTSEDGLRTFFTSAGHVLSLHAASPSARVPPESSRARERV